MGAAQRALRGSGGGLFAAIRRALEADGAMSQQYTHEEAEQILRIAVRQEVEQPDGLGAAGVSEEALLRMASELGLSPEAISAAAARYRSERSEVEERRLFNKHRRGEWMSHLISYVAANGCMMALDFWLAHRLTWSIWPLFGWGIFMVIHTGQTFVYTDETDAEFEKWQDRRRRRLKKRAKQERE